MLGIKSQPLDDGEAPLCVLFHSWHREVQSCSLAKMLSLAAAIQALKGGLSCTYQVTENEKKGELKKKLARTVTKEGNSCKRGGTVIKKIQMNSTMLINSRWGYFPLEEEN